jgi:hypothetical protein
MPKSSDRVGVFNTWPMKLELEKQEVALLTKDQMHEISGGGEARSDRLTGDCAFSRANGVTTVWTDADNNGCNELQNTGCYPSC